MRKDVIRVNATHIDPVFGEMQYKYRWYKEASLSLFDIDWNITIVAKAYSGKPITDHQRASYQQFNDHISKMRDIIVKQLIKYINDNCEEFALYWSGAKKISQVCDLAQIVKPTTLLIQQDGTTVLMFDCPWDEHGIAVQVIPSTQIGPQDIFI